MRDKAEGVQWKNTINAYKGIAAIIIAYFYHYKNEFGGEKPGVATLQMWGAMIFFLIFICMDI